MSHYRQSPPWKTAIKSLRWVATMRQLEAPGLGQRLNDLQDWCTANAGAHRVDWFNWNHSAAGIDYLDWYFREEDVARRFAERWPEFGLAVMANPRFDSAYEWQAKQRPTLPRP